MFLRSGFQLCKILSYALRIPLQNRAVHSLDHDVPPCYALCRLLYGGLTGIWGFQVRLAEMLYDIVEVYSSHIDVEDLLMDLVLPRLVLLSCLRCPGIVVAQLLHISHQACFAVALNDEIDS
jgi:hypothetical protein